MEKVILKAIRELTILFVGFILSNSTIPRPTRLVRIRQDSYTYLYDTYIFIFYTTCTDTKSLYNITQYNLRSYQKRKKK